MAFHRALFFFSIRSSVISRKVSTCRSSWVSKTQIRKRRYFVDNNVSYSLMTLTFLNAVATEFRYPVFLLYGAFHNGWWQRHRIQHYECIEDSVGHGVRSPKNLWRDHGAHTSCEVLRHVCRCHFHVRSWCIAETSKFLSSRQGTQAFKLVTLINHITKTTKKNPRDNRRMLSCNQKIKNRKRGSEQLQILCVFLCLICNHRMPVAIVTNRPSCWRYYLMIVSLVWHICVLGTLQRWH